MASPLLGYNTNVRHHGQVYHIQTEDSGLSHGHMITHLFADGGRIVASKKTTYTQHIGTERYPTWVKKLMQAQHKAMFIALRDGLFDTDEIAGAKEFAAREITLDEEAKADPSSAALDVDALERAAAGYLAGTAESAPGSVPAAVPAPAARGAPAAAAPAPAAAAPMPTKVFGPPQAETTAKRGGSGKYQATQPVTPSSSRTPVKSARPIGKQSDSVFGQDLLSEKTLDEVIMSYLAEDLENKE